MKWSQGFIYAQELLFQPTKTFLSKVFAHSLAEFRRIFWSFPILDSIFQYLTKLSKISWHLTNFHCKNCWFCQLVLYFLNICAFAFDDLKSFLQNFGSIQTGSKFGNFWLGRGERWKSPYCSYVFRTVNYK